jgi:hypothetical protein
MNDECPPDPDVDPVAYENGRAEARRDISSGRLRLFSGAPSKGWGRDLAETMRNRFGLEIVFVSCLVTKQSISFEQDYNLEVTRHLDFSFGKGSFEKAYEEVQCRRKQSLRCVGCSEGTHLVVQ